MISRTKLYLFWVLMLITITVNAQFSLDDAASLNVDEMTNEQVADFVAKYKDAGYELTQVEQLVLQKGMPKVEWNKLKRRIDEISSKNKKELDVLGEKNRTYDDEGKNPTLEDKDKDKDENLRPIFGASLFNSKDLTFEPNLNLPTPADYQIGTNDKLIVYVYGHSENTIDLTVSPEGFVQIPNIGLVQVSGLTMDQATRLITSKLSSIYTSIGSGTSVNVVLGKIRSIKVIMVGEITRPGTYTLPSVATVFNALNAAGGPNRNGSFRKIKVVRNNKSIAEVDIYDFLLTGELKNNVRLQDQDVIRIEPYQKRVDIDGEVKNIGLFETLDNESLADLINFSGGFTNKAYKGRITVFRNTDKEKSIADVSLNQFSSFVLQNGDSCNVGTLLDRYTNRVQIEGSVFRPGTYALEDGLTLMKLIEKADGLCEDAFMDRAIIIREKDDKTTEILASNLSKLLNGTEKDVLLRKEDQVRIASTLSMREKREVAIFGEINSEGSYEYSDNMTLKDLIFNAGGFKEKAEITSVEVARLVRDPEKLKEGLDISQTFIFSVDRNLQFADGANEFKLEPHDQVIVRPISGLTSPKKVIVEGEVLYPGAYMISSKADKISDLISRAGGFNKFAYPEGAFLIRKNKKSNSENILEQEVFEGISGNGKFSKEKFFREDGIVGINLEKIMKDPGSKWDLILQEGDLVNIPPLLQTVQVTGEVLLPTHIRFDKSSSFKSYISNSGGFTSDALSKKAFIVHANGTAESTKSILFIRKYPTVTPGAKIYVPEKPIRNKMSAGEILSIGTTAVSLASMITLLFIQLNR